MVRLQSEKSVELNVTAMLDMAFQLLAFFVLTFRPGPLEPAIMLHLPPAQAVTVIGTDPDPHVTPTLQPAGLNTLRINLFSTTGGLDRMTINGLPAVTFEILRDNLQKFLADPATPIEQVVIQANETLRYDQVMKVIGVCLDQKLAKTNEFVKLNLVAMADGSENP